MPEIDPIIEKWIKAIKLPMQVHNQQGVSKIPPVLTSIALKERFAQIQSQRNIEAVTDSEALIYLISKYASTEFSMRDQRLTFHLLRKLVRKYITIFPHMNPSRWDKYASLEDADIQYLSSLKSDLYEKREQFYKANLKDYADRSWKKFSLYLDPHFTADLPKNGKGSG